MEKKHKHAMLSSIVHIVNGDWASLVYDLTEMDVIPPRTNLRRVTMVISQADYAFCVLGGNQSGSSCLASCILAF
jgi:hypothetical protein